MNRPFMLIDDVAVAIEGEKNMLELIRKAGIDLPTFCYYSELSVYGACRLCMVENEWGGVDASCSTPPREGAKIYTNTPKLRKYRKMILELILADHCRDCTTCDKNGECKLQELAMRFGIKTVRFENTRQRGELDTSSPCIVRDESKCILCGDCVRMCEEVQNVGAIDFAHRGSNVRISTAFNQPIGESTCVGCGQCAAVCPTGAIVIKKDIDRVWEALNRPNTKVVAQIAPAVRVGIGETLGQKNGQDVMGKIVASLRRIGFDQVFDTSTGADITVIEESKEFLQRLESQQNLPLLTSCCPAWVKYLEQKHPEYTDHLSTCKSPMQMFGAVLKEYEKNEKEDLVVVGVMPCTAKKEEAAKEIFQEDGIPTIDYVITTQELIQMIQEAGIVFEEIEAESIDMPFGVTSGAGVIFGVTGGVTEAVIRQVAKDHIKHMIGGFAFNGVRGMEGIKEATISLGEKQLKVAIVSGLRNAEETLQKVMSGETYYDFIEVMACPGGCIGGAGQPVAKTKEKEKRGKGLYKTDRMSSMKRSEENPVIEALYNGLLKEREAAHHLLHVPNH